MVRQIKTYILLDPSEEEKLLELSQKLYNRKSIAQIVSDMARFILETGKVKEFAEWVVKRRLGDIEVTQNEQ